MTNVAELAERCENATAPDHELDAIIWATLDGYTAIEERNGWIVAVGKGVMERSLGFVDPGKHSRNFTPQHHDTPAYTASLDAAMTLIPNGWRFAGSETMRGDFYAHLITRELTNDGAKAHSEAHGDTLALAISAAALRAHGAAGMVARIASGTLPRENTEECSRAKPSGPTGEAGDAQPTPVSDPNIQ